MQGITVIVLCGSTLIDAKASDAGQSEAWDWVRRSAGGLLHAYDQDSRSDLPEQHRGIGWVGERFSTVIFEVREDEGGEFYHLVTLRKVTREERRLHEENS